MVRDEEHEEQNLELRSMRIEEHEVQNLELRCRKPEN